MARPKKEEILFNKGLEFYNNECYLDAIKSFDEAISRNERFSKAWIYKGLTLYDLEKYNDAIHCYDVAIEINPRNSWPWNNKGLALNEQGKYKKAIECLDQALKIAPRNDIAWGNKADALFSLDRFDQAIECYNKAIEINPRSSWYFVNKGNALLELNKYDEALISINAALEIDPDEETAWYSKGFAYICLNKRDNASECYNELVKLNSELSNALIEDGLYNSETNSKKENWKSGRNSSENTKHDEIQWLLLKIGSEMDLDVWVAKNDKSKEYLGNCFNDIPRIKDEIPRQFDEKTNKTIELIDVLWLKENAILAAFEIESTTSIYSGLLRMSDLISMQPNLKIPLYIVAPDDRRQKVFDEVNRPTFSKLYPPLNAVCRYICFTSLKSYYDQNQHQLSWIKHDILNKISESCDLSN